MKTCRHAFMLLVILCILVSPGFNSATAQEGAPPDPSAEAGRRTLYFPFVSYNKYTYYVAPNGSDSSGKGSASRPWATITHAVKRVRDNSIILVKPGTYTGHVLLDRAFNTGITIRAQVPYQARLRNNGPVVTSFHGKGITLEGFDIAHNGPGADRYVIQIQDLRGPQPGSGDGDFVSRIILRNNVIHDSYNDDLIKVNNGAEYVTIEGNAFYNQTQLKFDEHIDANSVNHVVIQDNIFFNDYAGSGRPNHNNTGSYIVVKDSNEGSDTNIGSHHITIRRNVFLHWEGSDGNNFIILGSDGKPYFEAQDVLIENNLMLGDSSNIIRAALGVKGAKDVVFRHNTVVGNLPSLSFAMRLNTQGHNPPNENIQFYNNIWSDPTGTMGVEYPEDPNGFAEALPGQTSSTTLDHNLYWNGSRAIPRDSGDVVNYTDDANRIVDDPRLGGQGHLTSPRWNRDTGRFADGSLTIREAFKRLVLNYGNPASGSPAINAADPAQSPADDILGRPRNDPDIGAFEH